jgi:hypothetical protein
MDIRLSNYLLLHNLQISEVGGNNKLQYKKKKLRTNTFKNLEWGRLKF